MTICNARLICLARSRPISLLPILGHACTQWWIRHAMVLTSILRARARSFAIVRPALVTCTVTFFHGTWEIAEARRGTRVKVAPAREGGSLPTLIRAEPAWTCAERVRASVCCATSCTLYCRKRASLLGPSSGLEVAPHQCAQLGYKSLSPSVPTAHPVLLLREVPTFWRRTH